MTRGLETRLDQREIDRIVRAALKDLGVPLAGVTVAPAQAQPGHWCIDISGTRPRRLQIRCGEGSSAQWVRNQVLEQYQAQS